VGLFPDEVIGFFSSPSPSCLTMALGLTQPLTEMSAGNVPGGKGSWCARLASSLPSTEQPILFDWCPSLSAHESESVLRTYFVFRENIRRLAACEFGSCSPTA
jgi:hypothetical protein